ncbi:MAG: hypothetical protein JW940_36420 [Polyangiaceae bacterium]|nr:hypothetical protein [Polyangiaceae bacterium]
MRRLAALLLLTTCCGASPERAAPVQTAAASHRHAPAPRPPAGCLWRDELLATIQAGLGSFLQHVELEPHLVGGRFSGFSIVALRPAAYWDGVDLRPGDIVTGVNGMPIEHPTEAHAAFVALGSARELRVSLIRDGVARQLVYRIVKRSSIPPGSARKPAEAPPAKTQPKKP